MLLNIKHIKVSVVLPIYDDELYIEQCMNSLLNQSLRDIEIICVDDGSTDNTSRVLNKYSQMDERVYVIRQENKGAGAARNTGMAHAKGEYIYFPDSDDIADVDLLEKSYNEAKRTEADVVVFKSKRLDNNTGLIEPCGFSLYLDELPEKRPFNISDIEGNYFRYFMGWAWDKLFKLSFVQSKHLRFQEQRTSNDMYFVYMSLIYADRISTIDEELYTQRICNPKSLSMTRDQSWECFYYALCSIREELKLLSKWDLYKSYFIDYALHTCLANLQSLSYPEKKQLKKRLTDEWFEALEINDSPNEYFTSEKEYEEYMTIKSDKLLENSKIEIAMICDSSYVIPTLVTIYSLYCNKNEKNYHISVICSEGENECLKSLLVFGCSTFEVDIIEAPRLLIDEFKDCDSNGYAVATKSALYKMYLPILLPELSKVIYLDGDVIVKKDISSLFQIDISDNFAAVVKDSGKLYSGRRIVKETENYFNSGVMVLNLDKLKGCVNDFVEEKKNQVDSTLMDQDVFNKIIAGNVKTIDNRFNLLYTNLVRSRKKFTISELNEFYGYSYESLFEIYRDSYIVHYSSKDKPWKNVKSPMARLWYKYYQKMKKDFSIDNSLITSFEKTTCNDKALSNCLSGEVDWTDKQIIVSMTSFPERIDTVYYALESLVKQIELPDKIVLTLAKEEFPAGINDLPESILSLIRDNIIEIIWAEKNIKSHKKYYYSMQKHPRDIVITVDDDLCFSDDMIFYLINSYYKFPLAVSATRAHVISFEDGKLIKYIDWKQEIEKPIHYPSDCFLATSGAGCLFPPNLLHSDLFDIQLLMDLCPTTDDIWLKIMQVRNDIPVVLAYPNMRLNVIKDSQKVALYRANRAGGNNDSQLNAVLKYYSNENIEEKIYKSFIKSKEDINNPAVSVILTICDPQAPIRMCLDSLVRQSLLSVEIIIIDDGSKNRILNEYAVKYSNVRLIIDSEINAGKGANVGKKEALGKYIFFADSYAIYDVNFLKESYLYISIYDAEVLLTRVDDIDVDDLKHLTNEFSYSISSIPARSGFCFDEIKKDRFEVITYKYDDKLFLKSFITDYSFDESMNLYGDMLFLARSIMNANRICYMDSCMGHYLIDTGRPHQSRYSWDSINDSLLRFEKYFVNTDKYKKYLNEYVFFYVCSIFREYELISNSAEAGKRYERLRIDINEVYNSYSELIKHDDRLYSKCLFVMSFDYPHDFMKNISRYEQRIINKKNADIDRYKIELARGSNEIDLLNRQISSLEYDSYCLNEVRKSKSYKIGLLITAIPRSVRKHIRKRNNNECS